MTEYEQVRKELFHEYAIQCGVTELSATQLYFLHMATGMDRIFIGRQSGKQFQQEITLKQMKAFLATLKENNQSEKQDDLIPGVIGFDPHDHKPIPAPAPRVDELQEIHKQLAEIYSMLSTLIKTK